MKYDYSKLDQKIIAEKLNHSKLAFLIGMKEPTLSNKLNSITYFKQTEIYSICKVLKIPHRQITAYFFTIEVQ